MPKARERKEGLASAGERQARERNEAAGISAV